MLRLALRSTVTARRAAVVLNTKRCFASYPPHEVIGLPALSPTMESGTLAKWRLKEGDKITAGEIICEIETDKAVVDYEATDDMFLAKILVVEGTENIKVGQPMMVVCDEEDSLAGLADFKVDDAADDVKVEKKEDAADESAKEKKDEKKEEKTEAEPKKEEKKETKEAAPKKKEEDAPKKKEEAAPKKKEETSATADVFAHKWGQSLQASPLSHSLLKKQHAYIAQFGATGTVPVEKDAK